MSILLINVLVNLSLLSLFIMPTPSSVAGESGHVRGAELQGQTGEVHLTAEQINQIGLKVETLKLQSDTELVRAPGTVAFNAYRLADVTSLVDGVVHARYVRLGDRVKQGQKLVTLISTALAQAEAGFLRAEAEHRKSKQDWIRMKVLEEQKIVSRARLQQAESSHQSNHAALAAARATLASYGLRGRDIDTLIKQSDYGQLVLRATRSGIIVADDFRLGHHIAAGALLMQISDDRTLWVEVRIPVTQLFSIRAGQSASIIPKGGNRHYTGKVVNIHPQLDAATRTAGVRLEVENVDAALHPGMFVDAEIHAGAGKKILLLPREAIQREGGKLVVFVEKEPGHYKRREVRVGAANMGRVPVLEGLKASDRVVTTGAFSVASELAKAGFAEE